MTTIDHAIADLEARRASCRAQAEDPANLGPIRAAAACKANAYEEALRWLARLEQEGRS